MTVSTAVRRGFRQPHTRHGCWLVLLVLTFAAGAQSDSGAAPPHYAVLPGARALAIAPDPAGAVAGISHDQPNDLAAAFDALARCRAANAPGTTCEIRWLNDERVTTGAELRARSPAAAHPLFLWRYTRSAPGAATATDTVATVYLAGTLHLLKPTLHPLPAPLEAAFRAAERLVVEVDPGRYPAADLERMTLEHARLPDHRSLFDMLEPPLRDRLATSLARHGIAPAAVADSGPAFVAQQLVLARLLALGYDPASGVEQHFLARRGARPVLELESAEQQLALLFGQPMPTQIAVLADVLAQEATVEPLIAALIAAWLAGDDAALVAAIDAQALPDAALDAYRYALLDARNVAMAARIAALLETPGTSLVLVGAAHLTGPGNVVELLAAQGLHGERIRSDESL